MGLVYELQLPEGIGQITKVSGQSLLPVFPMLTLSSGFAGSPGPKGFEGARGEFRGTGGASGSLGVSRLHNIQRLSVSSGRAGRREGMPAGGRVVLARGGEGQSSRRAPERDVEGQDE